MTKEAHTTITQTQSARCNETPIQPNLFGTKICYHTMHNNDNTIVIIPAFDADVHVHWMTQ